MQVTLKLYGNLKSFAPNRTESAVVDIVPGTSIAALLEQFGVPDDRVWMSALNDVVTDHGTVLHDGDVVEIFEPVGGGAQYQLRDRAQNELRGGAENKRRRCPNVF